MLGHDGPHSPRLLVAALALVAAVLKIGVVSAMQGWNVVIAARLGARTIIAILSVPAAWPFRTHAA